MVLFSGDCFAPSLCKSIYFRFFSEFVIFVLQYLTIFYFDCLYEVSTFTKGEQMVPVLNHVGTACAVYGNHDFGKHNIRVHYDFFEKQDF